MSLPIDSMILASNGFCKIKELTCHDKIMTPEGESANIISINNEGIKQIFRITFEDSRTIECTDDQPLMVWNWKNVYEKGKTHKTRKKVSHGTWCLRNASEIIHWFSEELLKCERAALPIVDDNSIEFKAKKLPIPPYTLGALIGDGHLSNNAGKHGIKFSSKDIHIINRIELELPMYYLRKVNSKKLGVDYDLALKIDPYTMQKVKFPIINKIKISVSPEIHFMNESMTTSQWAKRIGLSREGLIGRLERGWTVGQALGYEPRPPRRGPPRRSPIKTALTELGLIGTRSHEKFIPLLYKQGSVEQRISILQGLMDTDGTIHGRATHATFTSTSEQLAKDVQELAWSLGAIAVIREQQTHYYYNNIKNQGRKSWRVFIAYSKLPSLFSLPRKKDRCREKTRDRRLRIVSIDPVGAKETLSLVIDDEKHLFVTDTFIVVPDATI